MERFRFYRKNDTSVTINGTLNDTLALNDTDTEILKILKEHPEYTKEQLSHSINKSTRTVQRSLDKLKELKKIVRIGGKKIGYWEVIK